MASVSKLEGHNWRHGDIEDMLKTVAFIQGHKWTSMMIKRVYFGNWLRDYSQALDVGTLKGIQSGTLRILVWVLSFLSFGYATGEFEVTEERLGVYRPEEHIDNPKDYADNQDARKYDPRLRGPVQPIELHIDPETGMKNYIANERLGIATSAGYIRFSFARSIHFGRVYTSGASGRGKEADLCEAMRCLGQGLHCLEDFGAHTNYTELALREMGYGDVFPHTGTATQIYLHRHQLGAPIPPIGLTDVGRLGEATDQFAQSEVEQMDIALKGAEAKSKASDSSKSGFGDSLLSNMTGLLSQVPGAGDLARQAKDLQARSAAQERAVAGPGADTRFDAPPGSTGGPPGPTIPGTNLDPMKTAAQIYPILEFRDKVVRMISATIEKIPGLEALVEKITDTLTVFILSLLAPFIRPIINAVSQKLKEGSSGVIDASGRHQYEPWTDPQCTDPTHSLLSKDHFSNILNEPAGQVASVILQYVAPRIIYAWQNPGVPVDQVLNDVVRVFHHPAIRDHGSELHQNMFSVVERWARSRPDGGQNLNRLLSSESVKQGKNHTIAQEKNSHSHGGLPQMDKIFGGGSHSKVAGAPLGALGGFRDVPGNLGPDGREINSSLNTPGNFSGTQTNFNVIHPLNAPEAGYPGQPGHQAGQQNPNPQPSYFPQGVPSQPHFGGAQPYPQNYQTPPEAQYPPQHIYPGQEPHPSYPISLPPQQFGYEGHPSPQGYAPSPSQPYGDGSRPPPGQYYGGGQY
ncbi:MAG: hypothetical protein Q9163_001086 [Psora crenata]